MGIKMSLKNIKSIDDFVFDIPMYSGLYAITGENATGKSTLMMSMATSFFNPLMYSHFGLPDNSEITFDYNDRKRSIRSKDNRWFDADGTLGIVGFYEGSLTFGNRFKDVDFSTLKTLSKVKKNELKIASEFVKGNLGKILKDDELYYQDLLVLTEASRRMHDLLKPIYYYVVNEKRINQLQMSTGENLLLSILHSLERRLNKEIYGNEPILVLLDEVELALHSSALRRLVFLMEQLAEKHNLVVIFSTHSIEVIRSIRPSRIYFLEKYADNSMGVLNPCYPVYASRNLESSNYGHDFILIVEDSLAKLILDRILQKEKLLGNKRVLVIPVGGWTEVVRFTYDMIRSNLALSTTKILIVLDRDIKGDVKPFMRKNNIGFANEPNYLPIKSVEKFLLEKLTKKIDQELFRELSDYVFQNKSLASMIQEYQTEVKNGAIKEKDRINNGKALYSKILHELEQMRKPESELINVLVDYFFKKPNEELLELQEFLIANLSRKD